MLFDFIILFIISIKVTHDCSSKTNKQIFLMNDEIDYKIACSEKMPQKINLNHYSHLKSLSITGNSILSIQCPNDKEKIKDLTVNIHNQPTITFENDCFFKTLEIFNSPRFEMSSNKTLLVEKLLIHNQSYKFPLKYNKIKHINAIPLEIHCYDPLYVELDKSININCGREHLKFTSKKEISSCKIFVHNNDIVLTYNYFLLSNYFEDNLTSFNESLNLDGFCNILFIDPLDVTFVTLFSEKMKKYYEKNNLQVYLFFTEDFGFSHPKWTEFYYNVDKYSDIDDLNALFDYDDDDDLKNKFYYFDDGSEGSLVVFSTKTSIILIISIFSFLIIMIISLYIIGACRYKRS